MADDDESIWANDTLEVDDEGHVEGGARTVERDGYDVQATVTSYDFSRNGETLTNHVPNVVVCDETGKVVGERSPHDSEDPERAIKNAKSSAEAAFEDIPNLVP